jgi:hypothetical protein
MTMQADLTMSDPRPSTTRAAVTNRRRGVAGIDGRSAEARRYRDVVEAFAADLGRLGGRLTMAERASINTAAILVVRLEQAQAAVLRGEQVDAVDLLKLSDGVNAALERLPVPGP